jgi:hypothetical protein
VRLATTKLVPFVILARFGDESSKARSAVKLLHAKPDLDQKLVL